MAEKSKEELEREVEILNCQTTQRKISDERYAIKLVEKIVFALMAILAVAVLTAILSVVIRTPNI